MTRNGGFQNLRSEFSAQNPPFFLLSVEKPNPPFLRLTLSAERVQSSLRSCKDDRNEVTLFVCEANTSCRVGVPRKTCFVGHCDTSRVEDALLVAKQHFSPLCGTSLGAIGDLFRRLCRSFTLAQQVLHGRSILHARKAGPSLDAIGVAYSAFHME